MSETRYQIEHDSHGRWRAQIDEEMDVGVKILSETDVKRVEKNVHAYAVLDVRTQLGPLRIRNIQIMFSRKNQRHFVRWQQWETGKVRDGRDEWLDVAGPLDRVTRRKFEEVILAVFQQVRDEAAQGTLGRGRTGDQLRELQANLERTKAETVVETTDEPVAAETQVEAVEVAEESA